MTEFPIGSKVRVVGDEYDMVYTLEGITEVGNRKKAALMDDFGNISTVPFGKLAEPRKREKKSRPYKLPTLGHPISAFDPDHVATHPTIRLFLKNKVSDAHLETSIRAEKLDTASAHSDAVAALALVLATHAPAEPKRLLWMKLHTPEPEHVQLLRDAIVHHATRAHAAKLTKVIDAEPVG